MESHQGDVRTIWIRSPVTCASVVHSTWCSWAMWQTYAPTFNKWHKNKKKKNKKVTLHMLPRDAMRGGGLTSWYARVVVRINDNFFGMRESNVTIRSEIWTTHIRSLGFRDIRECVTLRGLILWSLGCMWWGGCHLMIDVPCFSNFHDIIHHYGSSPLVLRILENYSPLILGPTWVLFTLRGWRDMWGFFKSLDLVLKKNFPSFFLGLLKSVAC